MTVRKVTKQKGEATRRYQVTFLFFSSLVCPVFSLFVYFSHFPAYFSTSLKPECKCESINVKCCVYDCTSTSSLLILVFVQNISLIIITICVVYILSVVELR